MKDTLGPVTESGDIIIHLKAGATIRMEFQDVDEAPIDMSDTTVWFEVDNGYRAQLELDENENHVLILTLDGSDFENILHRIGEFALVDESLPPFDPIWTGKFIVQGWKP